MEGPKASETAIGQWYGLRKADSVIQSDPALPKGGAKAQSK